MQSKPHAYQCSTTTDQRIMNKKLEEIWIVIAWIMLLPLIFIFKLLGKLQAASRKRQA